MDKRLYKRKCYMKSNFKTAARLFFTLGSALTLTLAASVSYAIPEAEINAGATLAAPATSLATAPAKKQVFALIAAVGDQFTYVKQRNRVGSNIIDSNFRKVMKVPDNGLNTAVLRGLDIAIGNANPDSERVFLTLNPVELEGVLPQDRERIAIGKLVAVIEKMPERQNWDKIVIATPKFLFSEREGMGSKLQGFGVYVQPLISASLKGDDFEFLGNEIDSQSDSDTTTPDGGRARSKQYMAPFSYIQVYVLDAKTLKVLEKNSRHDYTKLSDPDSTAVNIEKSMTPEFLGTRVTRLIERSAAAALGATDIGTSVQIGDVKAVPSAPATLTPTATPGIPNPIKATEPKK